MFKNLLGDPNARKLKKYRPDVVEINLLEEEIQQLSDEALAGKTTEFKQRIEKGESLDELLPEAFAVVREASKRVLGMRHFDVQLIGGMVLHDGQIAEMKTGEGKTLVATLPATSTPSVGQGGPRGHRQRLPGPPRRRVDGAGAPVPGPQRRPDSAGHGPPSAQNYGCDITYGTNSEFGFDYLRDNMATAMEDVVQRQFQLLHHRRSRLDPSR
jgi:preprotein translocase subunit SecA